MSTFGIPFVKKTLFNEWSISHYEEHEGLIFNDGKLHADIENLISFVNSNSKISGFRREVIIEGMPFLLGIRPEEKAVYVGCRKLSREMVLLKLNDLGQTHSDVEKSLFSLKAHIEKISNLNPSNFPSELEIITFQENLPNYLEGHSFQDVDDESAQILSKLVKRVSEYRPSTFEKISDWGLGLTAQFDLIRIHLLKFLALLPSLDHDKKGDEVKRNLLECFRRLLQDNEKLLADKKRGPRALPKYLVIIFTLASYISKLLPPGILAHLVRLSVKAMAKRFIAGESIVTSHKTLRDLKMSKREATLDQLGELVVSTKEADEYFEKVLQLIHGMKHHYGKGDKNLAGIFCAHVSIKVSALSHDFRPEAFDYTFSKVAPRLKRILMEAHREKVFIHVDAEHYHYRDLVFKIYSKVLLESSELKDYEQTGIVVQAYLRDGAKHLRDVIDLAKKRNLRMPIRLVKGAYWDAETVEADAHEFTAPQFLNKEESDLHFRQLAYIALENSDWLQLCLASHNLQDHSFAESLRKIRFPNAPLIEHQCLHMTYEALSHGLAKMNWATRNYMPIGNLLVGMAYLVRRIMENSSQVGVLSIMRSHKKASGLLSPVKVHETKKEENRLSFDKFVTKLGSDFSPVRPSRLFIDSELARLEAEISKLDNDLKSKQDALKLSSEVKVPCSSDPELIVGTYKENSLDDAQEMLSSLDFGLKNSWWAEANSTIKRVGIFLKIADQMLLERDRLASLIVYEAGKTRVEALGDVDEAIDFLNFYAREEVRLMSSGKRLTNRGVFLVIGPWNFPLAIPCGMSVAPLVAGNAVLLKPAEQTSLIVKEMHDLFINAGVPAEIFKIALGDGQDIAGPLVTNEKVAGIVFTGSKSVGKWIYQNAANKIIYHYKHDFPLQKRVITEMGGKNAIIVTNNCELDETISGILASAFSHAGQKCSAASRVLVHKEVKEALVSRLKEAVRDVQVGSSLDASTFVNPLISAHDEARVKTIIEEAKHEAVSSKGQIIIDRSFEKLPGFAVAPAVFEVPIHQARKPDSWSQKEIFGPVIHIVEYNSLMEAVELFNSTEYALTGGIYAQSQDDVDFLLKYLKAGNIYVNRTITGARVSIEPFGGFKMSGTGPKAGGADYLMQFHSPAESNLRIVSNTKWATSSGYKLLNPRPSLIGISGRINRFEQFSSQFLDQFENLMGEVNEREKSDLEIFITWVKENLNKFLTSKHPNHTIPGQLSYNDKSIVKDAGLFIMVAPKPSLKSIYYFMSAIALGSGVNVACTTEESYANWKTILDIAWKSGFSKVNMDISLMSGPSLNDLLHESVYSYVYCGQYHQYKDELYQGILGENTISKHMRMILSDTDGNLLQNPSSILDLFVETRSLAINTMRHGAPLEINL